MAKEIAISVKNVNAYEDMFKTGGDDSTFSEEIEIKLLHEHPKHPFKPYKNEAMKLLVDSIKEHGLLHPIVVWKKDKDYFILSGHSRCEAYRQLERTTIKALVLDEIDENQAIQIVVESNLRQRQEILPSERAKAYKLLLDSHKKQGYRSDLHGQVKNIEAIIGTSKSNIYRYVALNKLNEELLDKIDEKVFAMQIGFDLCELSEKEQNNIYIFFIEKRQAKLSSSLSKQIVKRAQVETITIEVLEELIQKKEKIKNEIVLKYDEIEEYLKEIPLKARKEYVVEAIKFFSEYKQNK